MPPCCKNRMEEQKSSSMYHMSWRLLPTAIDVSNTMQGTKKLPQKTTIHDENQQDSFTFFVEKWVFSGLGAGNYASFETLPSVDGFFKGILIATKKITLINSWVLQNYLDWCLLMSCETSKKVECNSDHILAPHQYVDYRWKCTRIFYHSERAQPGKYELDCT